MDEMGASVRRRYQTNEPMMQPSPFQRVIYTAFQHSDRDITVNAVAGSGKTTTLVALLDMIPPDKTARFMAFNNSVVDELKKRVNPKSHAVISTLHSYGFGLIRKRYGNVKLNDNKILRHIEKVMSKHGVPEKRKGYYFYMMPQVVRMMRLNLIEPEYEPVLEVCMKHDLTIVDEEIMHAIDIFKSMNKDRKVIDFTDMIYIPVVDPSIRGVKYDYLLVDESQDMSACQHELIKMSIARKGRLITVGDPRQAIYGFAGADADSYNKLASLNGESLALPLSVSYRCSRAVVREAQMIVPNITAAPNAPEGLVKSGSLLELRDGDWILARNLRPLIETYIWLMKNRIKSKIRGKEIGEGLIALINKIHARTLDGLMSGIEQEEERLYNKLSKRGVRNPALHPKMESLFQKKEVLEFLVGEVRNVDELKAIIKGIFSDDVTGILLSTIHKAKGLENERIFFICPELIPSQYATMDWQLEQEQNLKYVAITRAKRELIYVYTPVFGEDLKVTNFNLN